MIDMKTAFKMTLQQMSDSKGSATSEELYAMAAEVERRIAKHIAQGKAPKKKLAAVLQELRIEADWSRVEA